MAADKEKNKEAATDADGTPTQGVDALLMGKGNLHSPTACPKPQKLHSDSRGGSTFDEDEKVSSYSDRPRNEMRRAEMRQITSALRLNYDVPESELQASPLILMRMLADPDTSQRTKISAIKTLLAIRRHKLDQVMSLHDLGLLNVSEEDVRLIRTPLEAPGPMFEDDPTGESDTDA